MTVRVNPPVPVHGTIVGTVGMGVKELVGQREGFEDEFVLCQNGVDPLDLSRWWIVGEFRVKHHSPGQLHPFYMWTRGIIVT